MAKVIFKPDNQNQPVLFPFSFDAFIPVDHPVRLINKVIDKLDISDVLVTYKGGGTSSYHPRILLKIIIFSYPNNVYSSRKIEKANKATCKYLRPKMICKIDNVFGFN